MSIVEFSNIYTILDQYYQGDCLDILPNLPEDIFDLIVIDPPNLILTKHFATRTYFRRSFGDLGLVEHFYKSFFKEFERVIKPTSLFYIFCNEDSYPFFWYYTYPFTKKIRLLTWDKIFSINGFHWRHQSEQVLFGIMPKAPKVRTGDGDVIQCKAVSVDDRLHPAEKPENLIKKFILKSSKPNQIVADFFAGSGKVLKIAKRLGRFYFGIEYDKGYYNDSVNELEKIKTTTDISKLNIGKKQTELNQFYSKKEK